MGVVSLSVIGSAGLYANSNVEGFAVVRGRLKGEDSRFNEIIVQSGSLLLTRCQVQKITMQGQIELDGTEVHGDITFEGETGRVILRNGAQVHGNVMNGTVVVCDHSC